MAYRVVYGETMPAWEKILPTRREARAFANNHRRWGDIVFSVRKVDYNDRGPHSLMGAIEADHESCKDIPTNP
jgi:hypothetical protein